MFRVSCCCCCCFCFFKKARETRKKKKTRKKDDIKKKHTVGAADDVDAGAAHDCGRRGPACPDEGGRRRGGLERGLVEGR